MADYLVLQSDDAGAGITLGYAVALAIAWRDAYPDGSRDDLAAHIGAQVDATRWRDETDTWRVVPDAEDLAGFRLPSVAGWLARRIDALRQAGADLARSDVRDVLYQALVGHLEREEERLRQEAAGPYMSPAQLSAALGGPVDEAGGVGMLAIANDQPLPAWLPEQLRATLSAQRRRDGWDDEGRRIDAPRGG